eukprot:scaffold6868_cov120-Skeletonema_marinoi.AAC.4
MKRFRFLCTSRVRLTFYSLGCASCLTRTGSLNCRSRGKIMFSYFSREESDYEIETTATWRDKIAVPLSPWSFNFC